MAKGNAAKVAGTEAKATGGKRGRQPRPDGVSDSEWFLSQAPGRVSAVIRAYQSVGRLGVDGYQGTEKEYTKMERALMAAHTEAFKRLRERPKTVKKALFSFE